MEYATPTLMLVGEATALVLDKPRGPSENYPTNSSFPGEVLGLDD